MPRLRSRLRDWRRALAVLTFVLALLCPLPAAAAPAQGRPPLSLPTPVGQPWRVIQGYACGTHNSWDRYSLDLVAVDGPTTGAPVRAAADGVVFIWVKKSGTLILHHGDGFYTMYTHMSRAEITSDGAFVRRGDVIGAAGDRGSPGIPHLHFTAFTAEGAWARNRQSVPLSFVEGITLPEIGGCSQHQGTVVTAAPPTEAAAPTDTTAPTIAPLVVPIQAAANQPLVIQWPAAQDDQAGVAGYRLYIGPDPAGTSEWFVPAPQVELPALGAGLYLLRVQPLDAAGNAAEWVTMGEIRISG
ncbi:MAG: hypothetical protein Fur005_28440 [Roseiflexaceae bacterium]